MKNWVAGLVGGAQGALTYSIQQDELARKEAEKREDEARREATLIAAEERDVVREDARNVRDIEQRKIEKNEDRQAAAEAEALINAREVGEAIAKEERTKQDQLIAEARRIKADTEARAILRAEAQAHAAEDNAANAARIESDAAATARANIAARAAEQKAEDDGVIRGKQNPLTSSALTTILGDSMLPTSTKEEVETIETRYFEGQSAAVVLERGMKQDAYVNMMLGDKDNSKSQRLALESRIHIALGEGLKGTIYTDNSKAGLGSQDLASYPAQAKQQTGQVMDSLQAMAKDARRDTAFADIRTQFNAYLEKNPDMKAAPLEEAAGGFYKEKSMVEIKKLAAKIGPTNPGGLERIVGLYAGAWQSAYGPYIDRLIKTRPERPPWVSQ